MCLKVKNAIRRMLLSKDWILLYHLQEEIMSPVLDISSYNKLYPPKGTIWADPFVLTREGKFYVFIEEMTNRERKGHISLLTMNRRGEIDGPVKIIEEPFHLSYPFVFEQGNELYIIPESKKAKSIRLYRCEEFPYRWEFEKELITGIEGADSTIYHHEGIYWIFTSVRKDPSDPGTEKLHLFWTDDPVIGKWNPHPKNPVVTDPNHSRPAGRIISMGGKIIRPTQFFREGFAFGMNLCEIDTLNRRGYSEKVVGTIRPHKDGGLLGIHTLNSSEGISVMDARIERRKIL